MKDWKRNPISGELIPPRAVVYCLMEECPLTRWEHETKWEDDKARSQAIVEGEPSVMGYCPSHEETRRTLRLD